MTNLPPLKTEFGIDTTDFKTGIANINREMRVVRSEFDATSSSMANWADETDGLSAKLKSLEKLMELQKAKADAVRAEYERVRKEKGGNSKAAQELQIKLNNENAALGRMQNEANQTAASLNKLQTHTGGLKGAFQGMGTHLQNLGQQVPALGTAFSLLSNPITIATGLLAGFGKLASESITDLVAYNKEVREMMQYTGLSAEETSRIIQVADDWGIELGEARTALEQMNKKGIAPSIDNLAKIADEYVNATDKAEFAREANQKYGKGFATLIPILAKGGDALREQAAAVNESMIATEDSIKASRKYEEAVDNLGDAWQGFKYTIGNEVIPILADLLTKINENEAAGRKIKDTANKLEVAFKAGLLTEEQYIDVRRKLMNGTYTLEAATKIYTNATEDLFDVSTKAYLEEHRFIQLYKDTKAAAGNLADETDDLTEATKKYDLEAMLAKQATEKFERSLDNLHTIMDGKLGDALIDFNESQDNLKQKMEDTQGEIDDLIDGGYSDMSEKVLGLKGDYEELKEQYTKNEQEHDRATKEILLDMLEQELTIGGLLGAEKKMIEDMAKQWGIYDQATADALQGSADAARYLQLHPEDTKTAALILQGQASLWDELHRKALLARDAAGDYLYKLDQLDGKTVDTYINTYINEHRQAGTYNRQNPLELEPEGPGGQHGLDMVVPQGYENDRYPIRASSGERVIIIPREEEMSGIYGSFQSLIRNISGGLMGGSIQPGKSGAILNQNFYYAPEKEMDMRRLARYVVAEIQRASI